MTQPILYSFRRCPYAIRARMTLAVAGVGVEHREVLLRDKPPELTAVSAKATVPVLVLCDGTVLDESIDIMYWALSQADPEGWLPTGHAEQEQTARWITRTEQEFKPNLDRYKYSDPPNNPTREIARERCVAFIAGLETHFKHQPFLFGATLGAGDIAIFPFIRQFANVEPTWFNNLPYPQLQRWLQALLKSPRFLEVMTKHPRWHSNQS